MKTTLMTLAVASACAVSQTVFAQEAEEEIAAEEEKSYSFGADVDLFSAYVWRNAVQNNQMVVQPCVWGEWSFFEPFAIGASIWQNYDLTGHRRDMHKTGLTENDYNVYLSATAWATEEEEYKLDLEFGHDWYTYMNRRSGTKGSNPNTRELYLKATFENPFVTVYGQTSWMYEDFGDYKAGFHYEIGLNKEIEVTDEVTVGADWNVSFANRDYQDYLYGTKSSGFAGTTVKLYSSYAITEWVSLQATIAYTGVLNDDARDEMDELGSDYDLNGHKYPRDLLWGGVSLKFEF